MQALFLHLFIGRAQPCSRDYLSDPENTCIRAGVAGMASKRSFLAFRSLRSGAPDSVDVKSLDDDYRLLKALLARKKQFKFGLQGSSRDVFY